MIRRVRYAVVGLGHIAQTAVLPAFKNAQKNSELTALVSGDPEKLDKLSKKYKIKHNYSYEEYETCLKSGLIDAVYIATPNTTHRKFAELAAQYRIHILTEKPMAMDSADCLSMIEAAKKNQVKLMVGYRLHFDAPTLKAIELAKSKKLGDLKIFNSTFTMQVTDKENIRLKRKTGGGSLYDTGIYCINAARYLFQAEPTEVFAMSANGGDSRFQEIDEITSATLRFPKERIATFTTSFGASESGSFDLIGTEARLRVENAYDYAVGIEFQLSKGGKVVKQKFSKRDQFAPELLYFSECVLKNRQPEPSGFEGLADIRIIEALLESARTQKSVHLDAFKKDHRPTKEQEITKRSLDKVPEPYHAHSPSAK